MNAEFNGRPEAAATSRAQFWRSMEELLPVFEREGLQLRLKARRRVYNLEQIRQCLAKFGGLSLEGAGMA